jgi:aspartate/methionine/tyrosine aminotransferase
MSLTLKDVSRAVRETQYAVRGPIVARAAELERQGRRIIYCNIGNPQSLGQKPLTYVRQILALAEYPELLDGPAASSFPEDARAAARLVLRESKHGLGAYTESKGYRFVRQAVADFVHQRDGIPADPEAVLLTDGASKGVQSVLRLLVDGPSDGVMIPIPQYPLYSASITLLGGGMVPYYLDEARAWSLSREALEKAHARASSR